MYGFKWKIHDMIMKIRIGDRDRRKRETVRFTISIQKGLKHHNEPVVSPPSSNRIHGCHDLHFINPENNATVSVSRVQNLLR